MFIAESEEDYERLTPILKNYYEYTYGESVLEPAISFSWESEEGIKKVKQEIKNALINTEILIIIGYSFPYFNRNIDNFLLNEAISLFKIRKIYLQDPMANTLLENLTESLKHDTIVKPILNTEQFYIPNEFG